MADRLARDRTPRKFTARTGAPMLLRPGALDEEWTPVRDGDEWYAQTLYEKSGGVGVVTILGPLSHHAGGWFDSYDDIKCRVKAAADDDDVKAIVLRIDSPGGEASGMIEASRAIRRMADRAGKMLLAFADECACSAAYGLACAASEVWTTETGELGSVGVILPVTDVTAANEKMGVRVELITTGARKGDGHPDKPIDDDVIAALRERVDAIAGPFFSLVAESRGMSPAAVEGYEAGVFTGPAAVNAGYADGVASWEDFVSIVSGTVRDTLGAETNGGLDSAAMGADAMAKTKLVKLTKARDDARAALLAASSEDERKKLAAAYEKAVNALAAEKTKYKKTVEEEETESDDASDESEEEDAEDESEEDESKCEDESEEEDASDESEEDEPEETSTMCTTEQEKKNAKALSGKTGLFTYDRLFRLAQQATGKRDVEEVFGALDGMHARLKHLGKIEARIAKIEGREKSAKIDAMIDGAIKDGRVVPSQRASLKTMGAGSVKSLAAFLDAQPKRVRTVDDGPLMAAIGSDGKPAASFEKLDAKTQNVIKLTAQATGKSVDDVTKDFITNARRAAGV